MSRRRLFVLQVALIGGSVLAFALGFGLVVGNHSAKDWLYSIGGSLEYAGVVLIASPELFGLSSEIAEGGQKIWYAIARRATWWWRYLKAKLGRRGRAPTTITFNLGDDALNISDSATVQKILGASGSVEERLEALEGVYAALTGDLDRIRARVDQQPESWRSDIETATSYVEDALLAEVKALRDRQLNARLLGILLLVEGVVVSTFANLAK